MKAINTVSSEQIISSASHVALNNNYISKDQNEALSALSYIYDIEANIKYNLLLITHFSYLEFWGSAAYALKLQKGINIYSEILTVEV